MFGELLRAIHRHGARHDGLTARFDFGSGWKANPRPDCVPSNQSRVFRSGRSCQSIAARLSVRSERLLRHAEALAAGQARPEFRRPAAADVAGSHLYALRPVVAAAPSFLVPGTFRFPLAI